MKSIRQIYKHLELIEKDMTIMQKCMGGLIPRHMFHSASSLGIIHLQELMEMVDRGGSTVQSAEFEFCGLKRPIRQHMISIGEYMKDMIEQFN